MPRAAAASALYCSRVRFAGIFVALMSIGCGTGLAFIPTREQPHALYERTPEKVEIFMTGRPNRPYVDVGMIESQQETYSRDSGEVIIAKMRKFAGKHGCDGLVIFGGNDTAIERGSSDSSWIDTLKGYRGSCIVYVADPAAGGVPAVGSPAAGPVANAGEAPVVSPASPPQPSAAMGCIPNSTQLCYGPGGCRGGQRCTETGRAYTLCDCGDADTRAPAPATVPSPNAQ
jgi:hypothetical protein